MAPEDRRQRVAGTLPKPGSGGEAYVDDSIIGPEAEVAARATAERKFLA
jgi:hypothetical protein